MNLVYINLELPKALNQARPTLKICPQNIKPKICVLAAKGIGTQVQAQVCYLYDWG